MFIPLLKTGFGLRMYYRPLKTRIRILVESFGTVIRRKNMFL